MAGTHYRAKDTVVLADAVDISGDARSVSLGESAETLDDTVFGADAKTKVASLTDGNFSMDALDKTGAWDAAWTAVAPGTTAVFKIHPEGTGAGLREVSFTGIVTERSLELMYEDLTKVSISGEISGVVTEGTQV